MAAAIPGSRSAALRDAGNWGLFLFFLALDGWTWGPWHDAGILRLLPRLALALVLAAWLLPGARRGRRLRPTPLDLPLLALLAAAAAATALSGHPEAASAPLLDLVSLALWWRLVVDRSDSTGSRARWTGMLLVASGLVCVQAVLEAVRWYAGLPGGAPPAGSWLSTGQGWLPPAWPRIDVEPPSLLTLGLVSGPNPVGGYLAVVFPLAVSMLLQRRSRAGMGMALLWLALGSTTLLLTYSRGAWLAAAGGSLTCLVLSRPGGPAAGPRTRAAVSPHRWTKIMVAVIAIGLAGAAVAATLLFRLSTVLHRVFIWSEAVRLWWQHPVFGAGPGSFMLAQLRGARDGPWFDVFPDAHNQILELLATLGLAGLLAGGWLAWRLGAALLRARREAEGNDRLLLAGCAGSLAAFGIFGLTDLPWRWAMVMAAAAVPGGIVAGAARPAPSAGPGPSRAAVLAAVAALLAGTALLEAYRAPAFEARAALREQRIEAAQEALSAARAPAGAQPYFQSELGFARAVQGLWEPAAAAYDAAVAGPASPATLANAAYAAFRAGRPAQAAALAAQAISADPRSARYRALAGWLAEQEGDWEAAIEAYGAAMALAPQQAGSTFWQETPERRARWAQIVAAARAWPERQQQLPPLERTALAARLLLALDDAPAAERLLRQPLPGGAGTGLAGEIAALLAGRAAEVRYREAFVSGPRSDGTETHYLLGLALLRQGKERDAAAAFAAIRTARPASAFGYMGMAELALARGEGAEAVRLARAASLLDGGAEASALLARALQSAGGAAPPAADGTARPSPSDDGGFSFLVYRLPGLEPALLPGIPDPAAGTGGAAVARGFSTPPSAVTAGTSGGPEHP